VNVLDNQNLGIVTAIAPLDVEDVPTGFRQTVGERTRVCEVEVSRLFTVPSPRELPGEQPTKFELVINTSRPRKHSA
jgi:hypothetical protein